MKPSKLFLIIIPLLLLLRQASVLHAPSSRLQADLQELHKQKNTHTKTAQILGEIDTTTDTSVYKFVSKGVGFQDPLYQPPAVVPITGDIFDLSLDPGEEAIYVASGVQTPLRQLAQAYVSEFGEPMKINSGLRSYEEQRDAFDQKCRMDGLCAYPRFSEHQSGLAVDIGNMHGENYAWMKKNAHRYGFHQSYQRGIALDHYHREDWHWRYLGVELATQLYENQMTYTEWVTNQ